MKTLNALALSVLLLAGAPATASPPADAGAPAAADAEQFDRQMAQMQANMKAMQEQMDRIATTKDPAERQRLMQQHMASMRSAMSSMHGMMGPGGCCAPGGARGRGMMGHGGPMTPEQMQERHRRMESMMGMQHMMMEQMLLHQQQQQAK